MPYEQVNYGHNINDDYCAEDNIALPNKHVNINWKKAKHGWAKYYDDGIITLDPKVFFRGRKECQKK